MNHVYYDKELDLIIVGIVKKKNTTYVQYRDGHWIEVDFKLLLSLYYIGEL